MKKHLKVAQALAQALDNQFKIGPFRFGLDPIVGLFPVIGDFLSAGFGAYIIWIAWKKRIPQRDLNKMVKNLAIDTFLGSIPYLGDVADFFYKSHQKNWDILEKYSKIKIEDAEIV